MTRDNDLGGVGQRGCHVYPFVPSPGITLKQQHILCNAYRFDIAIPIGRHANTRIPGTGAQSQCLGVWRGCDCRLTRVADDDHVLPTRLALTVLPQRHSRIRGEALLENAEGRGSCLAVDDVLAGVHPVFEPRWLGHDAIIERDIHLYIRCDFECRQWIARIILGIHRRPDPFAPRKSRRHLGDRERSVAKLLIADLEIKSDGPVSRRGLVIDGKVGDEWLGGRCWGGYHSWHGSWGDCRFGCFGWRGRRFRRIRRFGYRRRRDGWRWSRCGLRASRQQHGCQNENEHYAVKQ